MVMRTKTREHATALVFILPAFTVYLVFWIYPFIYVLYLSFHQWHLGLGRPNFVGFQQYVSLMANNDFQNALKNTFLYMIMTVPLFIVVALALAILVNRKIKGIGVFRVAYYLPVVTSLVAVGVIWTWLYDVDYGLLNFLLGKVGIPQQLWLSDTRTALPSIVVVQVWQYVGFYMIIYLAGLQNIPQIYYEVARMDGAGWWAQFRFITLPSLSEVSFLILIVAAVQSWRMFALVHVMTEGGPLKSTELILNYLYSRAFESFQIGYSSSIAIVMFVILLSLTLIQWKMHRRL